MLYGFKSTLLQIQMQVKLKFSVFTFLAFCLFTLTAHAQDEGQYGAEVQELLSHQHPELNLNDDKTLIMDVDARASKSIPNAHEIIAPSNTKNKTDNQTKSFSEKTEQDPLSFNFLYLIIQKFKISDIIDD